MAAAGNPSQHIAATLLCRKEHHDQQLLGQDDATRRHHLLVLLPQKRAARAAEAKSKDLTDSEIPDYFDMHKFSEYSMYDAIHSHANVPATLNAAN
ncbi:MULTISPECIES: hypothetical protein [Cryobacterium]|uniref:hypothetical protein n=1 Tax=Cryobacterium TaxID=69578 RepID=UPI000CD4689C|nr:MULTISPECIES: hypothetical protein [Cryobacterium]POH64521.1 hypothetical protein C3B60_13870 [Cryobacterium zongtaii]TFC47433.1 hypothetical protein E3O57_04685 [Cryobacterium sp. TMN-39-2]